MNMGPLRVAAAASFARVQPTGTVRSIVTLASRVGHLPCTCCCCCSSRSSPLPSKRIWSRTRRFATESSAGVRAAKVPHQALLSVEGRDAIKLLQGLVTNDVRRLEAGGDALYCAFLNPQGRMIATAFLHLIGPDHVLVDTDARTAESLLAFIKRFKVRSKVKLSDVSHEYSVWALWGAGSEEVVEQLKGDGIGIVVLSRDGRTPEMGHRLLVKAEVQIPAAITGLASSTNTQQDAYTVHRTLQGIPEGPLEILPNQSLPLEASLDYAGGVDFRKGCYVGQELTARTHHTGVVRKRVVPVSLYSLGQAPQPPAALAYNEPSVQQHLQPESGADVRSVPVAASSSSAASEAPARPARGRSAGKYLSGIGNVGLALLRLEQVARWTEPGTDGAADTDGLLIRTKVGEEDVGMRPWIPSWWPKAESEGRGKPAVGVGEHGNPG